MGIRDRLFIFTEHFTAEGLFRLCYAIPWLYMLNGFSEENYSWCLFLLVVVDRISGFAINSSYVQKCVFPSEKVEEKFKRR